MIVWIFRICYARRGQDTTIQYYAYTYNLNRYFAQLFGEFNRFCFQFSKHADDFDRMFFFAIVDTLLNFREVHAFLFIFFSQSVHTFFHTGRVQFTRARRDFKKRIKNDPLCFHCERSVQYIIIQFIRKTTNGAPYNQVLNTGIMTCNNLCSAVCDNMYL